MSDYLFKEEEKLFELIFQKLYEKQLSELAKFLFLTRIYHSNRMNALGSSYQNLDQIASLGKDKLIRSNYHNLVKDIMNHISKSKIIDEIVEEIIKEHRHINFNNDQLISECFGIYEIIDIVLSKVKDKNGYKQNALNEEIEYITNTYKAFNIIFDNAISNYESKKLLTSIKFKPKKNISTKEEKKKPFIFRKEQELFKEIFNKISEKGNDKLASYLEILQECTKEKRHLFGLNDKYLNEKLLEREDCIDAYLDYLNAIDKVMKHLHKDEILNQIADSFIKLNENEDTSNEATVDLICLYNDQKEYIKDSLKKERYNKPTYLRYDEVYKPTRDIFSVSNSPEYIIQTTIKKFEKNTAIINEAINGVESIKLFENLQEPNTLTP